MSSEKPIDNFPLSDVGKPWSRRVLLVVLVVSTIWSIARVPLWQAPEWGDEGHYVYAGWRILQGERLYLDFYDGVQKPPMMYWTAALAVKLIGRKTAVWVFLRIITILCKSATLLLVFQLGRHLASARVGLLAAGLFAFNSLAVVIGNQVMTEPYSTLFALLGLWLFLKLSGLAAGKPGRGAWCLVGYFASGLSIGIGMLYRPTPVFLGLVIGVTILASAHRWPSKLRLLGLFAGGVLVGVMPLILYLAINHGFQNFYVMVVRFMMKYPSVAHPLQLRLKYLARSFFYPAVYGWLIAAAGLAALWSALRRRSLPGLILAGWLALQMILMLVTLRQMEWHYLYELLPAFVLLTAFGFERLLRFADEIYVRTADRRCLAWLLEEGRLLFLLTTVFLPLVLLILCARLRWAALTWRAGLKPIAELYAAFWPAILAFLAGLLVIVWDYRQKWYLFLLSLASGSIMVTIFPLGPASGMLESKLLGLCLTFACGGWLWQMGKVVRRQAKLEGRCRFLGLIAKLVPCISNSLTIILWLFLLWFVVGQGQVVAEFGRTRARLNAAEAAAEYIRGNLSEGEGTLSCTGEINFLLGRDLPTYWGYHHEQVAARVGIDKLVGRELADVVSYCKKHRVRFIIFARRMTPARLGRAGEDYVRQNFRIEKWFGTYLIYGRKIFSDLSLPTSR